MTVRLSDIEYKSICNIAELKEISKAEVLRRMYWTVRTIYSDDDCVAQIDSNVQLSNALQDVHERLDRVINSNNNKILED